MTQVYLLTGIGHIFSSGLRTIEDALKRQGVQTHLAGLNYYTTMTERIRAERPRRVVMIGHSQGANNSILSAIELAKHGIPVHLMATLCPVGSWYFPTNVKHVLNFYTGSWGNYVPAQDMNATHVQNFDYSRDWSVWHMNIDKKPYIQQRIIDATLATLRS